jgi:hypothetical protein
MCASLPWKGGWHLWRRRFPRLVRMPVFAEPEAEEEDEKGGFV